MPIVHAVHDSQCILNLTFTFTFWQLLLNMQSLPKLEAFIHQLPKTVYVGDLRPITLELRNPCEIPVKVWPVTAFVIGIGLLYESKLKNSLEFKDLFFILFYFFTLEVFFKK